MNSIQAIERSNKWKRVLFLNTFTQSIAFIAAIPLLWFMIDKEDGFKRAVQQISVVVSLFALGDGLGYILAKKVYGLFSVKRTFCFAMLGSVVASGIFYLAGD